MKHDPAAVAALAGLAAGVIAARVSRRLPGVGEANALQARIAAGAAILMVHVRSPKHEAKARKILYTHGAEKVRVHESEIVKTPEHIPLSPLLPDPLLGPERLGQL